MIRIITLFLCLCISSCASIRHKGSHEVLGKYSIEKTYTTKNGKTVIIGSVKTFDHVKDFASVSLSGMPVLLTDSAGNFRADIDPGQYTVTIYLIAYPKLETRKIDFKPGTTTKIDFVLDRGPYCSF